MSSLEEARSKINKIDEKIAILFEERMKAVEEVIKYKKENNLEIYDGKREEEIINKNLKLIKSEKYKKFYKLFIESLMDISKLYQKENF